MGGFAVFILEEAFGELRSGVRIFSSVSSRRDYRWSRAVLEVSALTAFPRKYLPLCLGVYYVGPGGRIQFDHHFLDRG